MWRQILAFQRLLEWTWANWTHYDLEMIENHHDTIWNKSHAKTSACRGPRAGGTPVVRRYWIPPNATMPSRATVLIPALIASSRVTVKREAGSKFILRSNGGDVVVELGNDLKFVAVLIVPNWIPNVWTVDVIPVMSNGALNGLTRSTVTRLMSFVRPVVGRTSRMIR